MNEKTLPLIVQNNTKTIPLFVSGFTQSNSLTAKFDTIEEFAFIPNYAYGTNAVSNPGFEITTSASTITNWTTDYPYWIPISASMTPINGLPINYYEGTKAIGINLTLNTGWKTITSASFAVIAGDYYKCGFYELAYWGYIKFTDMIDGTLYTSTPIYNTPYKIIYPSCKIEINWYNNSTFLSTSIAVENTNATGGLLASELDDLADANIASWKNFFTNQKAPPTANKATIVISATCFVDVATSTKMITDPYGIAKTPKIYVDNIEVKKVDIPLVNIKTSGCFLGEDNFYVQTPTANLISNILTFSASSVSGGLGDVTGRDVGSVFYGNSEELYGGQDGTGYWKTWIPFTIDFTGITTGIHVVSASLVVTAAASKQYNSALPCKLRVGFDTVINPALPTSWTTLNNTTMNATAINKTIEESWVEGTAYTFDITSSAKTLFGVGEALDGITWTNADEAAVIIKDGGSSSGAFQTMVSVEGNITMPVYASPQLKIEYAANNYSDSVLDTYITKALPTSLNYDSDKLYVGANNSGSSRSLIYFDVSSIPTTATVTSACLCLYHEGHAATNTRTMRAYKMLKSWDLYTASWNKQYGTKVWDGGEGSGSIVDYYGALASGSISLSTTETVGWKEFAINSPLVEGWIKSSSGSANYGLMLKMDTENSDVHVFTSSQGGTSANHPYLKVNYTISATPYSKTIVYAGSTSASFSAEADSFIKDDAEDINYGDLDYLSLKGETSYVRHILIRFNLTGAGITKLSQGNIKLFCNLYTGTETTFTIHRVLKTWTGTGVTWRWPVAYPNYWSAEGMKADADYSSTVMGTGTVSTTGWVTINLTNLTELASMISTNYGIVIRYLTGGREERQFSSLTGTDPPQLNLVYTT